MNIKSYSCKTFLTLLFLCDRFPARRSFKGGGLRGGLPNITQM